MRFIIILYLFLGLLISSCSYKESQVLLQQKNSVNDTSAILSQANISKYRIKPHDVLQITNAQNNKSLVDITAGLANGNIATGSPQAQTDYMVEDDGTVALTGLGRIKVAGLTRIEARQYLESLYKKDILTDPLIDIKIINLKVTLFGEVKAPGQILLTHDNTTLIEVLAQAGGLTDKADNRSIKIVRNGASAPKTDILDLSDAKSLTDQRIIVQNGDIVVVGQNKRTLRAEKLQDLSTIAGPILLVINTALLVITLTRR
jgi:polysaccharide export outer membrane protein